MKNYSKILSVFLLSFFLFTTVQESNAQFLKNLANKIGGKDKKEKKKKSNFAEPHEGEFSDASGISGAYYPTSELIYTTETQWGTSKKDVKIVKIDYNGESKLTLYLAKDEKNPSNFYIAKYHQYALKTYKHYEFDYQRKLHIYNVEPGVLVLGTTNEKIFKPVVLVKDTAKISKYTYEDAKRLIAEGMEKQEKYNNERYAINTKMANVGDLTSNKDLMKECWKTIEDELSKRSDWTNEIKNYQMHYILNKQWTNDESSRQSGVYSRKFIKVAAVLKDSKDQLTYYIFGVVKPYDDAEDNYKGLKFSSNTGKQVIIKSTMDAKKAEVAKF